MTAIFLKHIPIAMMQQSRYLVFHDRNTPIKLVVATTRRNGTRSLLTSAKLSVGYLVVGITRELDKEPLLHCSSIYIDTRWFILQQCIYLISYYSSTMLLPQGYHAMSMCPDIILFNLHHHICTMRNHCPLMSSLTLTPSRLFPILLDC